MYKVKSNSKQTFDIEYADGNYKIDDQKVDFDCFPISEKSFHILLDNQSFNADLIEIDYNQKKVVLKVNHKIFTLEVADDFDQLLVRMGIDKGAQQKISSLNAPMPGLVLSISVKEGEEVKEGDSLLVLEAMKMENVLPSPTDGIIKKIEVKSGEKVDKNQALVTFE
jgi:biotin carboxyl carrier protein